MQIFTPLPDPYLTAASLDRRRLNKQIIEANIILQRIVQKTGGWANHPVVKMYTDHLGWLHCYFSCLSLYRAGDFNEAHFWAEKANRCRPPFLTDEFCDQHKRRLYTKDPERYAQWDGLGKSYENWYVLNGKTVRYLAGKIIKDNGHD